MKFLNDYSDVYEHFAFSRKLTREALKKYDLGSSRKTARRGSAASTGSSRSNSSRVSSRSRSTLSEATGPDLKFNEKRYYDKDYMSIESQKRREIEAQNAEFEEMDKIERAKMKKKVDIVEAGKALQDKMMKKGMTKKEAKVRIGELNRDLKNFNDKLDRKLKTPKFQKMMKDIKNKGHNLHVGNNWDDIKEQKQKIMEMIIDAGKDTNLIGKKTSKEGIEYMRTWFRDNSKLASYEQTLMAAILKRNTRERFTESFSNITTKRTIFTKMELKDSIGFIARFLIFKTLEKLNNVENFTQSTPTSSPSEDVDTEFNELIDFETKLIDIVGNFVLNSDFSSPKAKEFEDKIYNNLMNLSDENYNIVLDNHSVPRNLYDLTPQQMIIMLDISNREDKDKFLNDLINTKKLYDSMSDQEKINFENLTADEQDRKILALNDARNKKIDQEENKEENKEANETNKDNFKKLYLPLIIVFSLILLLVFIYLLI